MQVKIAATIVLYNPDIHRLEENIRAISSQVDRIVLVDNASENIVQVMEASFVKNRCVVIQNKKNEGIAKALNQGMGYAESEGYQWVLTLDQDTVCGSNLIMGLEKHTSNSAVGIIAPKYRDRNYTTDMENDNGWEYVLRCITSASLTRVDAWKKVGGFTEALFIDYVDYDFCAKLILGGYKIIRDADVSILHEIGNSKRIHLGKYSYVLYNHSAFRDFYIVRNTLYCCNRYGDIWDVKHEMKNLYIRCIMIALFEKNKKEKIKAMFKGWRASKNLIKSEL